MSLGDVGTFDQADAVYTRMTRTEPDPSVRDAAWTVLKKLLVHPDATSNQLSRWPDRFRDDPEKRLVAQKAWRDKLTQDISVPRAARACAEGPRRGAGEHRRDADAVDPSATRQGGGQLPRRARLLALHPRHRATTASLIEQEMHALLLAKQYPEAARFASERILDAPQDQETMGLAIRNELERLQRANDLKSAKALIDEAAKMNPKLEGNYADSIRRLAEQIEKKLSSQGPSLPPGVTAGEQ